MKKIGFQEALRQIESWANPTHKTFSHERASQVWESMKRLFDASYTFCGCEDVPVSFDKLRVANMLRLPQFKNGRGGPAHEQADGSDWTLGEWNNAALGELGEAANIIKKIRRGDFTLNQKRIELAFELADAVIYIDHVAKQAGIDLGEAVATKFNIVSRVIGSDVVLPENGPIHV